MSIISKLKGWVTMKFLSWAKQEFRVKPISSEEMQTLISECANVYAGKPDWLEEGEVKTINFAKALCSETARLATLDIGITIEGSARAEYLQKVMDELDSKIRKWTEYCCAYGSIILKPNGKSVDVITPEHFTITATQNDQITGIVFQDTQRAQDGEHFYHRLEYHNNDNGKYTVTNKTYFSEGENDIGIAIGIENTPWRDLDEETTIENAEGNLFAFMVMPHANNIDLDSPLGMPVIADCLEELKDLDIAYSRNALEIIESKRIVLVDSDKLVVGKGSYDVRKAKTGLPDMVRIVEGDGAGNFYQEINPLIQTSARMEGINALLSQIGYKCGFSNGYFVFNESMGIQTATGVEANQQRTIQYIKDVRDQLQNCLEQLIYALSAFADGYDLAPAGDYEVAYKFGDITYNVEEDRARWWGYVQAGKVPAWKFFVKFEGMTEEDAKQMVADANADNKATQDLFSAE